MVKSVRFHLFVVVGIFWLAQSLPSCAAPPQKQRVSLHLAGAVEKSRDWTAAQLEKAFSGELKTVSYTLKGTPGEARCVPLLTLVQAAKPRFREKTKNHQLAFVVIVRGADGYTATFSMGELLPQYGKREVWIALDQDGKPLTNAASPVQLLVPEDGKPSRWIHGVGSIIVLDCLEIKTGNVKR